MLVLLLSFCLITLSLLLLHNVLPTQATFGPTLEDINALVGSGNNFDEWVQEQMYELPASSLRQFYRRRVNPKTDVGYRSGTTSSRPCELFSRWRKYALTSKDTLDNRKTKIYKVLRVDYVAGVGYVWKVDNVFRTVTQYKPVMLEYIRDKERTDNEWKWIPSLKPTFVLGAQYRFKEWDWQVRVVVAFSPSYEFIC